MDESESRARNLFRVGAVWNWLVGGTFWAFDAGVREAVGLPQTNDPFIAQLLYLFVILLGIGYFRVSQDLTKNHDMVRLGAMAKLGVFGLAVYHFGKGTLPWPMLVPAVVDLGFALKFIRFLVEHPEPTK